MSKHKKSLAQKGKKISVNKLILLKHAWLFLYDKCQIDNC